MDGRIFSDPRRWRKMARGFLKMKNASEDCCLSLFEEAEALLLPRLRQAFAFRVFPLVFSAEKIRARGSTLILTGNAIRSHLKDCDRAAFFCATLGAGVESALAIAQAKDMALAMVADAVASALTELLCDDVQEQILSSLNVAPSHATSRFSPGYGDLSLTIQKDLLQVLDARRRLGVSLSEGGLLLPRKTVTAVIGIKNET